MPFNKLPQCIIGQKRDRSGTEERIQDEKFLSWKEKRITILNKYTTTEKLSIATVCYSNFMLHIQIIYSGINKF